jgi:AraC family transcriptional regulator of adaptative response / DNA-3-methyladenine glycosylase II
MVLDRDICYRAVRARDRRFDGRFFTGVTSIGVYCRPVCPARTPRREHCTFFACAAAAEEAGFRPCRRCRPESAPGTPVWEGTSTTVQRALRLIDEGALDGDSVDRLAERLGVGGRHLRRLFALHLGATPRAVARTRRIHFARRLIVETDLPLGRVALAAGFGCVRRFNAALRDALGCAPSALRRRGAGVAGAGPAGRGDAVALQLAFRPPLAWETLLGYLAARAVPGLERIDRSRGEYRRLVRTPGGSGTIAVRLRDRDVLELRVDSGLAGSLLDLVRSARALFDLDADPGAVARTLSADPLLGPLVARRPGLRVPGTWDRWELAVRAILGQQVSVAGARTLAGRLVARFGTAVERDDGLWHLFPEPERLVDADLRAVGIPVARQEALRGCARAWLAEPLLESAATADEAVSRLAALPGIGPWTAGYIALRALRDPDALPAADLGLRRALAVDFGGRRPTPREVVARAERWRPWRGYAVLHLWQAEAGTTDLREESG